MRLLTRTFVVLTLVLVAVTSQAATRRVVLRVETAPLAWGDSRLAEHLVGAFSRDPDLRPVLTSDDEKEPRFPTDSFDLDSLVNWGAEIGGRYLLVVKVDREALERRKTFNIPLIAQRWETIGVLAGELRLIDLQKRRLLLAEPFELKKSGSRQFQAEMDNNKNDPSLHLSAAEKGNLFRALELDLVERLIKDFQRYTRGR